VSLTTTTLVAATLPNVTAGCGVNVSAAALAVVATLVV
jgi:hypothetical protein